MAGTNDAVAYMEKLTGSGGLSAVTAEQMMTAYNASLWHQLTEIMVTWFRDVTDGKVVRTISPLWTYRIGSHEIRTVWRVIWDV